MAQLSSTIVFPTWILFNDSALTPTGLAPLIGQPKRKDEKTEVKFITDVTHDHLRQKQTMFHKTLFRKHHERH